MVDAVTLDFGGSPLADFSMPDASGLVPLSLPEAVPNGSQKPLQQPSPEVVRRFQEAMKAPVSPITLEPLRRVAEQKSVVVETVVRHETIDKGGDVEALDTPRVSRPMPQTPFTPQREMTRVVTAASPAAAKVVGTVETPVAQATPFVDKPAMPTASVAAPVVEVPVRPVAASVATPVVDKPAIQVAPVAAPVVNEAVRPVAAPVAAPAVEETVPTPIVAEAPRRVAESQSVVVETVVRHETIGEGGEVETIDMPRVPRPVPQVPSTPQRETTHVATEASPAATQVVGVVATPSAQATPVVDRLAMPVVSVAASVVEVPVRPLEASFAAPVVNEPVTPVAIPVAAPVVEVPVRPVVVPVAAPVATPVADEPVRPVAAPIAAPAVENPVATPIAAEIPRKAAEPQSVVVETVVRHETKAEGGEVEMIETSRVSRPVQQTPFTPQRETTHVVTEASLAATHVAEAVATPVAQATPVVNRPAMPATPVAVPVVEVPVTPVAVPVATPVFDEPVRPVATSVAVPAAEDSVRPVAVPIAEEPVATPIAAEAPRRAVEPQSGVVEIVVAEASPAATQVAEAVATPAAQVTPVVDKPAMQVAPNVAPVVNEQLVAPVVIPVAAPVVEVPVRPVVVPVAAPVATPVADVPVRPVAVPVVAPVVDEPVTPVAVPVAAPIAEEPVVSPIAPEIPRSAAELHSVVVETVVRHETIAEGAEVETMAAPRVPRPVPQTPSTPSREATHVAAKTPDEQEAVLQAVPVVAAPPEYLAASVPLREDGISVAAATARTEVIVETVNKMVEAVVGQISVTPSLVKGEGEVHMTFKPTVLDGSDITLTAKDGTLTVAITPATPKAAQSAAAALPRLEAALAEHVAAFHHVSVALVAKKGKTDETA